MKKETARCLGCGVTVVDANRGLSCGLCTTVDAATMEKAGVRSIQVHTGGECTMDAEMTAQAIEEFKAGDFDLLFLENVGNLVCPAETDTGASVNVTILSVLEGDDKPLKYPLMYEVCQAVMYMIVRGFSLFS